MSNGCSYSIIANSMKAFLIFMTFAISASYGQMNVHRLILTKEQNDSWISQLRAAPEDTRLKVW